MTVWGALLTYYPVILVKVTGKKKHYLKHLMVTEGFPGGSDGTESSCNAGDLGSILRLRSSSGQGHGSPLQYSCLENPHGQRCLVGYSPWGDKKLDTTERLSTHMASELRPFPPLYPPSSGRWRVYSTLIQPRQQDSIFSKFPVREFFFPGGARYHHFSSSAPSHIGNYGYRQIPGKCSWVMKAPFSVQHLSVQ